MSDRSMPPLGPPYAPRGALPPPIYPGRPPTRWPPAPPVIVPVEPEPAGALPPGPGADRGDRAVRRRALVLASIGSALVVIVALIAWSDATDRGGSEDAAGTTTTVTTEASSAPQDLGAAVAEIERFVERERGLPFRQPVDVRLAGDAELAQLLAEDFAKERGSMLELQEVLRATGLVSPRFDVVGAQQSLLDGSVLGFYDPETKQLVVRGAELTPFVRETLAHELTHALDDQWFDLDRPELDTADDETSFAFTTLVEGDAVHVQNAYLASLSVDEQSEAFAEEQQLLFDHPELFALPEVLIELVQEPYLEGPFVVQDLLDAGDRQQLDSAFVQPPTTSEQIFDTQRYLDGEGAVDVPAPVPDAAASNRGVLGVLFFQELLRGAVPISEVDQALDGWGGDHYVTWIDTATGTTCLRDTFVGDSPQDTVELATAITDWASGAGAIVDAPLAQPATFTVCS